MPIQNLIFKRDIKFVNKSDQKEKLDFSSPAATFDTHMRAIKLGDLETLQSTLDPESKNKDLQQLRTDVNEAKEWMTFKKKHLHEIRLGNELSERENVKIYKLIDPSASTSALVFHKHDGHWLISDTLKH